MLFGGAVWVLNAYLDLPDIAPTAEKSRPASKETAARDETIKDLQTELSGKPAEPIDDSKGSFDVARIDPEGHLGVRRPRRARRERHHHGRRPGARDGTGRRERRMDVRGRAQVRKRRPQARAQGSVRSRSRQGKGDRRPHEGRQRRAARDRSRRGAEGAAVGQGRHQEPPEEPRRHGRGRALRRRSRTPPEATPASQARRAATRRLPRRSRLLRTAGRLTAGSNLAVCRTAGQRHRQGTGHACRPSRTRRRPPSPRRRKTDTAQEKTVVPVPITFVFNEASFTDSARRPRGCCSSICG